jgi:hypothetical protein
MTLLLSSCQKKPEEPQAVYAKYRSSVVLVLNRHYYSMDFDNGLQLFFTLNEKGATPELYQTEADAVDNASVAFGTGFFIGREGQIATNRHVANPVEQGRETAQLISKIIGIYKESLGQKIAELLGEQVKLRQYYNANMLMLNEAQISDLSTSYAALEKQVQDLREQLASINYDPRNTKIHAHVIDIGVAYDNTYVTSFDDFKGCVLIKEAKDPDVDLAIIQLKDKRTPEHIRNLIPIAGSSNDPPPGINDDVYMIGYNEGLNLAVTNDGVKSQFTGGKVMQEPDGSRMLYSIPTLPGSSGSPVIDRWGNLVAVNFAKVSNTQSFGFGIPKIHLAALMNGDVPSSVSSGIAQVGGSGSGMGSSAISAPPVSSADERYRRVIRGFVAAEDQRDFERIYGYMSGNMRRYWDIDRPGREQLFNRYRYIWGKIGTSRNIITEIRKMEERTFDLYTEYEYFELRRGKTISISSRVRFHFDTAGMIDEIYGIENR